MSLESHWLNKSYRKKFCVERGQILSDGLCSSWRDLSVSRAPAGKERDLFSISVPAIDLLYDLNSMLCFLTLQLKISAHLKSSFCVLFLWSMALPAALWALYSHVQPPAIMKSPGFTKSGASAWDRWDSACVLLIAYKGWNTAAQWCHSLTGNPGSKAKPATPKALLISFFNRMHHFYL